MTMINLKEVLAEHKKWLQNDGGSRAILSETDLTGTDLTGANLRDANLSRANLRWADLRWADLRGVDLTRADLTRANLSGADLTGANLREANLTAASLTGAAGYLMLPVSDPRHYGAHGIMCEDGWHIRAGCRDLTITEAKMHWGNGYKGDRQIGDSYLSAIKWLEERL